MNFKPSENHELNLAGEFVQYTGSHIFLTGKAGTGKTTFLQKLKESLDESKIADAIMDAIELYYDGKGKEAVKKLIQLTVFKPSDIERILNNNKNPDDAMEALMELDD